MGIQTRGKSHTIKITLGYEPVTRKRLYYTETFKGTKREARLREAELKIHKRDKKLVLSSGMIFRECFNRYCGEVRSKLSINCFATYEYFGRYYLFPTVGDKKLSELVTDDFQNIYDSLGARSFSPRTIHTLHTIARASMAWARQKRLLSRSIFEGIKLPKIPDSRPEYLTYGEMQAFFDAAPDYWYGNAFKFQFMTGLRNQELMALMWSDINFDTAELLVSRACAGSSKFVGFKCTKTGVNRIIELDLPTVDFLKRLKTAQEEHIKLRRSRGLSYGDDRLIFCTSKGQVPCLGTVRGCFKQILTKIGIARKFRWYGIRHTHATHLLDTKRPNPKMIADRMGHSVPMLFKIYGHSMRGQQRRALSQISSRVKL